MKEREAFEQRVSPTYILASVKNIIPRLLMSFVLISILSPGTI